jgi:2,4-dienoyl-CoA reductase-like NADH-dependent reductase (Old Yellow Enzyme family)
LTITECDEDSSYIRDGEPDAVAFGQLFITKPDLAVRFADSAPLNTPDPATFFTPGAHG